MPKADESQKSRMLAGDLYDAADPALKVERERARRLMYRFNQAAPNDPAARAVLDELLGELGPGSVIRPPFHCDYGYNIKIGAGSFFNYGCVLLDVMPIVIGEACQFGPYVQLLTPDHPREPAARRQGLERGDPITIGDNVWIGGGAMVLPGVSIGADAIVAAGAVITRDVAPGTTVGGSPGKLLGGRDSRTRSASSASYR